MRNTSGAGASALQYLGSSHRGHHWAATRSKRPRAARPRGRRRPPGTPGARKGPGAAAGPPRTAPPRPSPPEGLRPGPRASRPPRHPGSIAPHRRRAGAPMQWRARSRSARPAVAPAAEGGGVAGAPGGGAGGGRGRGRAELDATLGRCGAGAGVKFGVDVDMGFGLGFGVGAGTCTRPKDAHGIAARGIGERRASLRIIHCAWGVHPRRCFKERQLGQDRAARAFSSTEYLKGLAKG